MTASYPSNYEERNDCHLFLCSEREEELSRLLATRRGQLGEHETAAQRAARAAEAERERAAQLKREADPLAR